MLMKLAVDCFREYTDFSASVKFEFIVVTIYVQVHCPQIGLFIVMKSIEEECSCCLVVERLCPMIRSLLIIVPREMSDGFGIKSESEENAFIWQTVLWEWEQLAKCPL